MKDLIQALTIFIVIVAIAMSIFVWLVGPTALIIGLSIIGLLVYGAGCAIAGAWWTERSIKVGATVAITSTSKNDEYDTRKIEALADLAESIVKSQNKLLPTSSHFPELTPPQNDQKALRFDDAIFKELE